MVRLPKGVPLFENLETRTLQLDTIINKLVQGRFSGYAKLEFLQANGILVYSSGRLISALHETDLGVRLAGTDALAALAEQMLTVPEGRLHVYRLSEELISCIYALLNGEQQIKAQPLAQVDIEALLDRIKQEQLSCYLIVHTPDQATLIAYSNGTPAGFFHDGSVQFSLQADVSQQQITKDSRARLDFHITATVPCTLPNLLDGTTISSIWHAATIRHNA